MVQWYAGSARSDISNCQSWSCVTPRDLRANRCETLGRSGCMLLFLWLPHHSAHTVHRPDFTSLSAIGFGTWSLKKTTGTMYRSAFSSQSMRYQMSQSATPFTNNLYASTLNNDAASAQCHRVAHRQQPCQCRTSAVDSEPPCSGSYLWPRKGATKLDMSGWLASTTSHITSDALVLTHTDAHTHISFCTECDPLPYSACTLTDTPALSAFIAAQSWPPLGSLPQYSVAQALLNSTPR